MADPIVLYRRYKCGGYDERGMAGRGKACLVMTSVMELPWAEARWDLG